MGILPARGIACDVEDFSTTGVATSDSRDRVQVIKVAAQLTLDVGEDPKHVVDEVASSRSTVFQVDDIGGFSYSADGPTQPEIELMPLSGKATELVVLVRGVFLVSHDSNAQCMVELQRNVLERRYPRWRAR